MDLAAEVEDMPTTVDPKKVRELVGTMSEMFPKAPLRYLEEQCEDLVGHPAAIERFVEQLARNDSQVRLVVVTYSSNLSAVCLCTFKCVNMIRNVSLTKPYLSNPASRQLGAQGQTREAGKP